MFTRDAKELGWHTLSHLWIEESLERTRQMVLMTPQNNKAFHRQHLSFHWGVMSALPSGISVKRCSMPRDRVEEGSWEGILVLLLLTAGLVSPLF